MTIAVLAAFLCGISAQDRRLVCGPLRSVCESLAAEANVALTVRGSLGEEVILASVSKDRSVNDFLKDIAWVTRATLTKRQGGWELARDDTRLTGSDSPEASGAAADLGHSLDKAIEAGGSIAAGGAGMNELAQRMLSADRAQRAWTAEREASLQAMRQITPLGECLLRAARLSDLRKVVMLRPGERVVFSTLPTSLQQPFRSSISGALKTLAVAQKKWAAAVESASGVRALPSERTVFSVKPTIVFDKVLLTFARPTSQESYEVAVIFARADGRVSARANLQIRPVGTGGPKLEVGPGASVALSTESKALLDALSGKRAADAKDLPANILKRPSQFEPMRFCVLDLLAQLARSRGKDVVACLPDRVLPVVVGGFKDRLDLRELTKKLLAGQDIELSSPEGDPILLRPMRLYTHLLGRTSRRALEDALNAGSGPDTSWTLGGLASSTFSRPCDDIAPLWMAAVNPALLADWLESDHYVLQLIAKGALDPNLKKGARSVAQMALPEREIVRRMVLSHPVRLTVTDNDNPPAGQDLVYYAGLGQEPTEVLAVQSFGDLTINSQSEDEDVLVSGIGHLGLTLTPEDLAMRVYLSQTSNVASASAGPVPTRFYVARRRRLSTTLQLDRWVQVVRSACNTDLRPGKEFTFEELPEAIRSRVAQRLALIRTMPPSVGESKAPPP